MPDNRDYFTRPVQSDRTSYGYGHTDLQPEHPAMSLLGWAVVMVGTGSLLLALVACGA